MTPEEKNDGGKDRNMGMKLIWPSIGFALRRQRVRLASSPLDVNRCELIVPERSLLYATAAEVVTDCGIREWTAACSCIPMQRKRL
jgi:hypothetical protein